MARLSTTGGKKTKAKARKASPAKGRKTAKTKRRIAPAATPRKLRSVSELTKELKEAREQQAASAEILKVINVSPRDLTQVFDIILEKAHSLCDVPCGSLQLYDGDHTRAVAVRGMTASFEKFLRHGYRVTKQNQQTQSDHPVQIDDLADVLVRMPDDSVLRAAVQLGGIRTMLSIPLAKDGVVFGRIVAGRQKVRPFSDHQIALLHSFADQAVIAIENARLFNETKEVIASSPSDVQPVFQAIADRSNRLVDALSTTVFRLVDGIMHLRAFTPTNPEADATLQAMFPAPLSTFSWGESIRRGEIYHRYRTRTRRAARPGAAARLAQLPLRSPAA